MFISSQFSRANKKNKKMSHLNQPQFEEKNL